MCIWYQPREPEAIDLHSFVGKWEINIGWKIMEKGVSFALLHAVEILEKWFLTSDFSLPPVSLWMCHRFKQCHPNWKLLKKIQKTDSRFRAGSRTEQQPRLGPTYACGWHGLAAQKMSALRAEKRTESSSAASLLSSWPYVDCQLFCRQRTRSFCLPMAFCSLAPTLCNLLAISGLPTRQFSYLFTQGRQTSAASLCKE